MMTTFPTFHPAAQPPVPISSPILWLRVGISPASHARSPTLTQEHPEYMLSTGEFVMTGSSQAAALVSGDHCLAITTGAPPQPDDEIKCKLTSSAETGHQPGRGCWPTVRSSRGTDNVNATRASDPGCQSGVRQLRYWSIKLDLSDEEHLQGPAIVEGDGSASLPGLKKMVSLPAKAEKGLSKTRKWGVKDHIERPEPGHSRCRNRLRHQPFDWPQIYMQEKATIENLAQGPAALTQSRSAASSTTLPRQIQYTPRGHCYTPPTSDHPWNFSFKYNTLTLALLPATPSQDTRRQAELDLPQKGYIHILQLPAQGLV